MNTEGRARPAATGTGSRASFDYREQQDSPRSPMCQAAIALAEIGWSLFRVLPFDKRPLASGWQKEATNEPARIVKLWEGAPRANIGLLCSVAFWVLDVDGEEGRDTLARLQDEHGALPATVTSITGSGGLHLFFQADPRIRNSVKRLPGLDTRGRGGFIVAAGSLHPNGQVYHWAKGLDPWSIKVAAAPCWLVDLLDPVRPPLRPLDLSLRSCARSAYAEAAFRRELERLARAGVGGRNHQLYTSTRSLAELVAAGLLDLGVVISSLASAALGIGLTPREVEATLASAVRAGLAHPREVRHG